MARTISDSGVKPKLYHHQFSVALNPLEKALVEYYASRFGTDRVAVLRGMLRKYVQMDSTFDPETFIEWAAKSCLPQEDDREKRAVMREQVEKVETLMGLNAKKDARKGT